MGDTKISWTMGDDGALGKTWNPIRGCSRISAGCMHCYAERMAGRFAGPGQPYEGLVRIKTTIANNEERDPGNRREARWTGEVRLVAEHLADPLRWRKPRRIFVNSMSDLFHEGLTNEQIAAVFGVMAAAPQHTFQVLTKRSKRMREWFAWIGDRHDPAERAWNAALDVLRNGQQFPDLASHTWPLPNVWLGVSVEDQAAADERIPELLATPAAVRFLSCEPLIGQVDLSRCAWSPPDRHGACETIDWVIAGCESGPGMRPCTPDWLRSLRDQCADAEVAFFLKQATISHAASDGAGSKRKAGGVIELPYLDGEQHVAFPGGAA